MHWDTDHTGRRLLPSTRPHRVLGEADAAMNCAAMIEAMATKGYWKSPGGQTPHATLYSAILREINTKGKDARFKKVERGKFELTA